MKPVTVSDADWERERGREEGEGEGEEERGGRGRGRAGEIVVSDGSIVGGQYSWRLGEVDLPLTNLHFKNLTNN